MVKLPIEILKNWTWVSYTKPKFIYFFCDFFFFVCFQDLFIFTNRAKIWKAQKGLGQWYETQFPFFLFFFKWNFSFSCFQASYVKKTTISPLASLCIAKLIVCDYMANLTPLNPLSVCPSIRPPESPSGL